MRGRSARTGLLLSIGLIAVSLGAHWLILRSLPGREVRPTAAPVDIETIAMTLVTQATAESEPPPGRDAVVAVPEPKPVARRGGGEVSVRRVAPPPTPAPGDVAAPHAARAEPSAVEPEPSPAVASRIDVSARGTALSTLPLSSVPVDDFAGERGRALSAQLRASANANPARARKAPELVRDADGTCHYAGAAINATVLPDGGVRFEDKSEEVSIVSVRPLDRGQFVPRGGAQMPPEHPVTPEEMLPAQQLDVHVRFAGRAWDAERAWFLRQTEGLRRELADTAHERQLAGAQHELRKQLDHIWCDTTAPPAARRRALFQLWDEMAADEIGQRGRRVLFDYIHDNLPKGSALAYPDEQLVALNAGRTAARRFDPYGVAVEAELR